MALCHAGITARGRGRYAEARALHEEALKLSRAAGNRSYEGVNLSALAHAVYLECDYEQARVLAEQSRPGQGSSALIACAGTGALDVRYGTRLSTRRPTTAQQRSILVDTALDPALDQAAVSTTLATAAKCRTAAAIVST